MLRSKHILNAALLAALCTACTVTPGDGSNDEFTRDQARALGGKTDHVHDICDWMDWYGDGICDEFCPRPDPDCASTCFSDFDCTPIFCFTTPCPQNVCVDGECVVDDPDDRCDPGSRECATCYGNYICSPNEVSCPLLGCPPPRSCGGLAGLSCGEDEYCDFDDNSCGYADQMGFCAPRPDSWIEIYAPVCGCDGVTYSNEGEANGSGVDILHTGACEPPERCEPGERECPTCEGAFVCAPFGVSCPLLHCPPPPRNCGGFAGLTCADDEYCDYADDSCGYADQMGTCTTRPTAWIEIYAPVCGCDGVTYSNEGEAYGNGADVLHVGACPPLPL